MSNPSTSQPDSSGGSGAATGRVDETNFPMAHTPDHMPGGGLTPPNHGSATTLSSETRGNAATEAPPNFRQNG